MKSSFGHHRRATSITVAMTPMIDVVFLLLVFFLCTASFQKSEGDLAASLLVETSEPGAGSPLDAIPLVDEVTITGREFNGITLWTVNQGVETNDPAELVSLLQEIAEIDPGILVTIDPDQSIPLGHVVQAYDAARMAGFATVRLAASIESIAP